MLFFFLFYGVHWERETWYIYCIVIDDDLGRIVSSWTGFTQYVSYNGFYTMGFTQYVSYNGFYIIGFTQLVSYNRFHTIGFIQ